MGKLKLVSKSEVLDFLGRAIFCFIGEFLGSAIFTIIACSAEITTSSWHKTEVGISLALAFSLVAAIESVFYISGGLINPVLSIAGIIYNKFSIVMGVIYIFAQLLGSILGYGFIFALTPEKYIYREKKEGFCVVKRDKNVSAGQAFLIEFVGTSILVMVVCTLWDPRNNHQPLSSIKIAFVIFAIAYGSCSFTGCSMNPARALGPAFWNHQFDDLWIFWTSPIIAGCIWPYLYVHIYLYFTYRKPVAED